MDDIVKHIAILGSTGSIGQQTLDVVRALGDRFQVAGLGAGRNVRLLARQVEEFQPEFVSFQGNENEVKSLLSPIPHSRFLSLEEIASHPDVDLVLVATSGKAGLAPTLAAIRAGKQVALANKEVLVMAGGIVMAEARRHGVEIAPVDSEHSAIWQCLQGERKKEVARLILTASGGPFRHYSSEQLATITPQQALNHPTWQMGKKVTIDSATLMNKGMEIIEAHWLFDMPIENIDVIVHPNSIIHSLVEFADGSVKAQLSPPDMRLPIQYALTYPKRLPNPHLPRVDWSKSFSLDFEPPDLSRFPCLKLAMEAGKRGGTYPAVLSAADDVAVELFLSGRIGLPDIAKLVEQTMEHHVGVNNPSLEEVLIADTWARKYAKSWRVR